MELIMKNIWKKLFQIIGCTTLFNIAFFNASLTAQAQNNEPVTVVELFTSQGCSSCPPADAFLGKLTKRKNIIPLTLPVDYWDYLGWKDTLAKKQYTNRQKFYARTRGDGQVYTPQIVINGISHAVGSNQYSVDSQIQKASKQSKETSMPISLETNDSDIWVKVGDANPNAKIKSGTIWLAHVSKNITVSIGRGENTGRTITYYNVVKKLKSIGNWSGNNIDIKLKQSDKLKEKGFYVVFVQSDKNGLILAATRSGKS